METSTYVLVLLILLDGILSHVLVLSVGVDWLAVSAEQYEFSVSGSST